MSDGEKELAMLIAAHAAQQADPLTRFVASLPPEMRAYAEDARGRYAYCGGNIPGYGQSRRYAGGRNTRKYGVCFGRRQ